MPRTPLDAALEGLRETVVERVAGTAVDLPLLGGREGLRLDVWELLENLASAVELATPELFRAHVAWARALSGGRRIALLRHCLEAIGDLLGGAGLPRGTVDTAHESLRLGLATLGEPLPPTAPPAEPGEVERYLEEASRGRRPEALARVERWRVEAGPTAALLRLAEAQREVGERWYAGELRVSLEHRITAITEAAVHRLPPPPGGRGRAIVACAPGNFHTVGPLIAGALLGHQGWEVEVLGADVPPEELGWLVADARPDLVGLGVATLSSLPGARDAAREVRAACPGAVLIAGGWAARQAGAGLLGVDGVAPGTFAGSDPALDEARRRSAPPDGPSPR